MRDSKIAMSKNLLKDDIIEPSFFQDIAELESVEVLQGENFIDPPHYEKNE